jgi:hypothetical protein
VDELLVTLAINRLSEDHRTVLFELCHRGASVAQAAQTLGVPPETIKSRAHYAIRALQAAREEMGGLAFPGEDRLPNGEVPTLAGGVTGVSQSEVGCIDPREVHPEG